MVCGYSASPSSTLSLNSRKDKKETLYEVVLGSVDSLFFFTRIFDWLVPRFVVSYEGKSCEGLDRGSGSARDLAFFFFRVTASFPEPPRYSKWWREKTFQRWSIAGHQHLNTCTVNSLLPTTFRKRQSPISDNFENNRSLSQILFQNLSSKRSRSRSLTKLRRGRFLGQKFDIKFLKCPFFSWQLASVFPPPVLDTE